MGIYIRRTLHRLYTHPTTHPHLWVGVGGCVCGWAWVWVVWVCVTRSSPEGGLGNPPWSVKLRPF